MADEIVHRQIMEYLAKAADLSSAFEVINVASRAAGLGSEDAKFQDIFHGINRSPNMSPLPSHRELQGLTLFTKPNLNLSYDNIAPVRQLAHLLVQDTDSYQYAIKAYLDPLTAKRNPKKSALVDHANPYMPLLSNTLLTMSPPPDIGVNIYSSPEGMMKEVWIMQDSIASHNGRYDLTTTFNNVKGNAVLMLFHTWLIYMGELRTNRFFSPHPEQRLKDEMDYFTRIERYKFDASGRKIEQWFHTGASVPTNISIGAGFSFNREEAGEMENKQISVQFACVGAVYNDPIQLFEFNMRVQKWNPFMADTRRKTVYVKVPYEELQLTNFHGYPWINLATNELEWWVEPEVYSKLTRGFYK